MPRAMKEVKEEMIIASVAQLRCFVARNKYLDQARRRLDWTTKVNIR